MQNRQRWLAIGAIAVVAVFAGDKLLFTPLINFWKGRAAQIATLEKNVKQGASLVQREQSIRRRWEQMRRNTLPTSTSKAEEHLLNAFDYWAQESRVSVLSITPQWKRETTEDFISLECRVEAFGSLDTVSRFLYEIEKDPMGLKLDLVEISARDNNGQQLALGLQISGVLLNTQVQ